MLQAGALLKKRCFFSLVLVAESPRSGGYVCQNPRLCHVIVGGLTVDLPVKWICAHSGFVVQQLFLMRNNSFQTSIYPLLRPEILYSSTKGMALLYLSHHHAEDQASSTCTCWADSAFCLPLFSPNWSLTSWRLKKTTQLTNLRKFLKPTRYTRPLPKFISAVTIAGKRRQS